MHQLRSEHFFACHPQALEKVGNLGSLGLVPMIQPPFNSSCKTLLYGHGNNWSGLNVCVLEVKYDLDRTGVKTR